MTNLATPAEAKRTPPDLKWLLNERAAMAGRIQKAQTQRKFFDDKIAAAEQKYQAVVSKYAEPSTKIQEELSRYADVLDALDKTIKLTYQQVRCDAAGVVTPWAGRYGERGALTRFVQQALQDAAPNPISMKALIDASILTFELVLPTPGDRRTLKYSVRSSLETLHSRGLAERCTGQGKDSGKGNSGSWRWRNRFGAAALRSIAAAAQSSPKSGGLANDLPDPT